MKVSGAGVKSNIAGVLLDIVESWEGLGTLSNSQNSAVDNRGYAGQASPTTPTPGFVYASSYGGGGALTYDATAGRSLVRNVSGAAHKGRASLGTSTNGTKIPLGQRFAAAGALPIPFYRPLRSYELRVPVRVSALAGGAAFVGVSDGGAGEAGGMPFSCAYGWTASPGLNGGRWTARFRQAAAGAITDVGDSGVLSGAVNWNLLGLRYTEGPVPTVEWLMDGVPLFVVSGDANMGILTSSQLGPFPCVSTLAGVGTTFDSGPSRFIVQELGG